MECDTECNHGAEPNDEHTACGGEYLSVHIHCISSRNNVDILSNAMIAIILSQIRIDLVFI